MAEASLTELQRISLHILNKEVYDIATLRKRCPLDYGRHTRVPATRNLGNLGKLPAELLHQILRDIDLQTLLAFRKVSMSAMGTVEGVMEYAKVMKHASNAVRCAVAICTSRTFSIRSLFLKLCQKSCDGKDCDKPAPYIDVFGINRRCLGVGGGCQNDLSDPVTRVDVEFRAYLCSFTSSLPRHTTLPFRSFRSPSGDYHPLCRAGPLHDMYDDGHTYYDYDEIATLSPQEGISVIGRELDQDSDWSLCSVTAPWLSVGAYDSEHGIFCDICEDRFWNGPISIRNSVGNEFFSPDPQDIPFMAVSHYDGHVQQTQHSCSGGRKAFGRQ